MINCVSWNKYSPKSDRNLRSVVLQVDFSSKVYIWEPYSKCCHTSKMELWTKIWTPLTNFVKSFNSGVWQGSSKPPCLSLKNYFVFQKFANQKSACNFSIAFLIHFCTRIKNWNCFAGKNCLLRFGLQTNLFDQFRLPKQSFSIQHLNIAIGWYLSWVSFISHSLRKLYHKNSSDWLFCIVTTLLHWTIFLFSLILCYLCLKTVFALMPNSL